MPLVKIRKPVHNKLDLDRFLPLACISDLAAIEFMERQRWGTSPSCPSCDSSSVSKKEPTSFHKTEHDFLWRCHQCKAKFTVRKGTMFEDPACPLRHWIYILWKASTSETGVGPLEIQQRTEAGYEAAQNMLCHLRDCLFPSRKLHIRVVEDNKRSGLSRIKIEGLDWQGAVRHAVRTVPTGPTKAA